MLILSIVFAIATILSYITCIAAYKNDNGEWGEKLSFLSIAMLFLTLICLTLHFNL